MSKIIKAERVDIYCKRHGIEPGALPNESYVLLLDEGETLFVGETKELVEKSSLEIQARTASCYHSWDDFGACELCGLYASTDHCEGA